MVERVTIGTPVPERGRYSLCRTCSGFDMHKARAPLWWYELRYGNGWRVPVILGAFLILIVVAISYGTSSPEAVADRQRQVEARCVAQGGRIVVTVEKFGVSRICYGA